MPRKKEQNLAKKQVSVFLDPPPELEGVLLNDALTLSEEISKASKAPKLVPIAMMQHAASKHILDLRPKIYQQSVVSSQQTVANHQHDLPKEKKPQTKNTRLRSWPSIPRFIHSTNPNNFLIKTHSRRLGNRFESLLARNFNELAIVNLVALALKFAHLGISIFKISRVASGTVRVCVGKACVIIPRFQVLGSRFQVFNHRDKRFNVDVVKAKRDKKKVYRFDHKPMFHVSCFMFHESGWQRALLSFVCLSLIFVLPLKGLSFYGDIQSTKENVLEHSKVGLGQLVNAATLAKFSGNLAASEFERATISFAQAQEELDHVNAVLSNLAKLHPATGRELETGKLLISSAEHLSRVATVLATSHEILRQNSNILNKISDLRTKLSLVLPDIIATNKNLSKINPNILNLNKQAFEQIKTTMSLLTNMVFDFVNSGDLILSLLGADSPKKYLIVFQNNGELRPTGGFIGSLAEIRVDRGAITDWRIPGGGPYDLRGALRVRIAPPPPLRLISSFWQFHDANWFPDFPTSAKKLAWFYERSGGPTVDGVIAMNASLVQELLKITGSIDLPEYDKVITAENFLEETQKAVELEYDRKINQPKKFIADLVPRFITALQDSFSTNYLDIIETLEGAIQNKDLQVHFRDELAETRARGFNWTGEVDDVEAGTDYLMAVNSNIGGQKSDAKIQQKILHRAEIDAHGTITNSVVILRKHNGIKNELFYGARNVDYLRLYVPAGSVLLEASGFRAPLGSMFKDVGGASSDEDYARITGNFAVDRKSSTLINNEFEKTVFGGWMQTDPGEETIVMFKYRLPWKLNRSDRTRSKFLEVTGRDQVMKYSLFVQKQSGITSDFVSEVKLAASALPLAYYPDFWKGDGKNFEIKDKIDKDKFYSLLLK